MDVNGIWQSAVTLWKMWTANLKWLPEIVIVFAVVLVVDLVYRFFSTRLEKSFKQDKSIFANTIVYGLHKPARIFIWLLGIFLSLELIEDVVGEHAFFAFAASLKRVSTILLLMWACLRFLSRGEYNITHPPANRKGVNKTTALAIGRLLRISVVLVTILLILGSIGIDITGLLVFGTSGTLVAGIAAKDLLANFFGGFMVFFDRPFSVGDLIKITEKNIEGIVEHIGWRVTLIRTMEKKSLYVPNAIFLTICIENMTRLTNRRIREVLGIRYSDVEKLPHIIQEIEEMLHEHPDVDQNHIKYIAFNKFGPSSMDCLLQCFTKETKIVPFMKVQQDILMKVSSIVRKHGGDMAFPTTTVHIEK